MGGRQRVEHGLDHGERPGRRHRGLGADQVAHGQARNVLHHQEEGPVVVAGVEDRHDVLVRQPGGRTGLALEPPDELGVLGQAFVHHLHGDRPVQAQVGGLVDGRHPPAGDPWAHAVPAVEYTPHERVGSALHVVLQLGRGKDPD
jgi:hypothetical protein